MANRILILFISTILFSCAADDDECEETITFVKDTAYWFDKAADTNDHVFRDDFVGAVSDDSLTEIFEVDYYRSAYSNPTVTCDRTYGDRYKKIEYRSTLNNLSFSIMVASFDIGPYLLFTTGERHSSLTNNDDILEVNARTGEMKYGTQVITDASFRFVGDTIFNGKNYQDVYIVKSQQFVDSDIKTMMFSKHKGVLLYQSHKKQRTWILDN